MATIAPFTGPQDGSQIFNYLDQLIAQINGFVTGGTAITIPIVAGTTAATLGNTGSISLNSTVASAVYQLPAPVRGNVLRLIGTSTKGFTVKGLYSQTRTLITATSTGAKQFPAAILVGVSTAAWAINAVASRIKCT